MGILEVYNSNYLNYKKSKDILIFIFKLNIIIKYESLNDKLIKKYIKI